MSEKIFQNFSAGSEEAKEQEGKGEKKSFNERIRHSIIPKVFATISGLSAVEMAAQPQETYPIDPEKAIELAMEAQKNFNEVKVSGMVGNAFREYPTDDERRHNKYSRFEWNPYYRDAEGNWAELPDGKTGGLLEDQDGSVWLGYEKDSQEDGRDFKEKDRRSPEYGFSDNGKYGEGYWLYLDEDKNGVADKVGFFKYGGYSNVRENQLDEMLATKFRAEIDAAAGHRFDAYIKSTEDFISWRDASDLSEEGQKALQLDYSDFLKDMVEKAKAKKGISIQQHPKFPGQNQK